MEAKQALAIYEQAEKNLKSNPNSQIDQFIVDLWDASKNLYNKNTKIAEQLAACETEKRHQAARIDLLESRLARFQDSSPPTPYSSAENGWMARLGLSFTQSQDAA